MHTTQKQHKHTFLSSTTRSLGPTLRAARAMLESWRSTSSSFFAMLSMPRGALRDTAEEETAAGPYETTGSASSAGNRQARMCESKTKRGLETCERKSSLQAHIRAGVRERRHCWGHLLYECARAQASKAGFCRQRIRELNQLVVGSVVYGGRAYDIIVTQGPFVLSCSISPQYHTSTRTLERRHQRLLLCNN